MSIRKQDPPVLDIDYYSGNPGGNLSTTPDPVNLSDRAAEAVPSGLTK